MPDATASPKPRAGLRVAGAWAYPCAGGGNQGEGWVAGGGGSSGRSSLMSVKLGATRSGCGHVHLGVEVVSIFLVVRTDGGRGAREINRSRLVEIGHHQLQGRRFCVLVAGSAG